MTSHLLAAADAAGDEDFVSFDVPIWVWATLTLVIVAMLITDLLLVHRTAHVITIKEAAIESAVWISIGLLFGVVIIAWQGGQAGGEYYAGFLIEKSLSVDNVFVWAVIFAFFTVPREYQFRVLFWGIFGALVLRAVFIFAGVALIERFEWILYVFGAFLLYTAVKIARHDEDKQVDYDRNLAMRLLRRFVPTTADYDGQKLFTRRTGRRLATPLFAVLILIEATDVVFAVDSVPAVLAVSREPFIVFASNAFAILGLRSLYFLLGGMQGRFRYLNIGLGVILAFVGIKMLLIGRPFEVHLPTYVSLGFIAIVLTLAIWASVRAERRERAKDITAT
jgi:tellurite resistance protein TerC